MSMWSKLPKHSNDHGLAAPSLVQDAHDCSDILYVGSNVVLQRPSRLKGVEIGLVLAFKLRFRFRSRYRSCSCSRPAYA